MNIRNVTRTGITTLFAAALFGAAGFAQQTGYSAEMQAKIQEAQAQLQKIADDLKTADEHLTTFDTLDYVVFSGQEWARLHESHSADVIVNWPDGHRTYGISKHIEDLKALFVYAPDTRIKQHPIRIGQGEWTCVTGIMEGTFTQPMPAGEGKFIQPTGKKFAVPMCTVGHWKNGVMIEEFLYWDNATYLRQIGLGN